MQPALTVRAGPRALDRIRRDGLDPSAVALVPGAAGGPKGLGISGLDRLLFSEWLPSAPRVRHLVGASIGAWRFAAAASREPAARLAAFADAYVRQCYPKRPSPRYVTDCARDMLGGLFRGREAEILSSEQWRLHVLTVRGRGALARDGAWHTPLAFGLAAMANAVGRRHLSRFLDRTLFHDPRERPPFLPVGAITAPGEASIRFDAFHTHLVALDPRNLVDALLASASIPLVLEGIPDIASAPQGVYWDGGIIDYHLHLPFHQVDGLVLYPHFTDRIVPGWLDKSMPWRVARGEWLDNVVLVSPSRAYLDTLPHRRLPDRKDFRRFMGDDEGRMRFWRQAISESDRLAEDFLEFARRPDPSRVLPL